MSERLTDAQIEAWPTILLVAELATNAICHARSPFSVALDVRPDRVRAEVTDAAPATAELRELVIGPAPPVAIADTPTIGGYGLPLIRALACRCGIEDLANGDKTIWCERDPRPHDHGVCPSPGSP